MFWSVLRIAVAVYVIFGVIIFLFQKRFIYHPTRQIDQTPAGIGLAYEDVTLTTSDGVKITGWYVPADGARGTALFFHGNAGNISHRLPTLEMFHQMGLNALIIDYRGYGNSEGSPSEKGTYRDAEAAWEHLVKDRGEPPGRIVIFGRSLGGGVASWLAVAKQPAAVILESAFTSVPDMARKMYPIYPIGLLTRVRYDTLARIGELRCPVLVVHSRDDELVPPAHGRKLFEAAPEPKQFIETRGGHNEGFVDSADYESALRDFLYGCLPK